MAKNTIGNFVHNITEYTVFNFVTSFCLCIIVN